MLCRHPPIQTPGAAACIRLLVFALLLSAGWPAQAVQDCELNGQSVNPANGATTAGKTGLMRCRDRDTGQLQREQELRDGRFMGLRRYFEKGHLVKEHSVNERGNLEGLAREFSPSGRLLREANYRNGSEEGLVRSFHDDGSLSRATFYAVPNRELAVAEFTRAGKLSELRCGDRPMLAPAVDDRKLCGFDGASTVELYGEKGPARGRIVFDQGKRTQVEELDDGTVVRRVENSDSRRVDRRFFRNGTLRFETVSARSGDRLSKISEQEYSERAVMIKERRWQDGELTLDRSFYLNGQPERRDELVRDGERRIHKVQNFYDNGTVSEEVSYLIDARGRRQLVEAGRMFSPDGVLLLETVFDDRGNPARERRFDERGKLLGDDEVFADGSRKAYSR